MEVRQLSADNIEEIMKFEQIHAPDKPLYARATRADLDHVAALILYLKNGFIISDYKRDVYGEGVDRVYMTTN